MGGTDRCSFPFHGPTRVKLHRKLGFWAVFCIASGAMISSGLFVLPGMAFRISGPAVVLAYALAALMVIPALLSKAELTTAMPRSGGSYFFVERSMGALPGALAGLANWLSIALKSAFAMVGIGAFAKLIWDRTGLPPLGEREWIWLVRGVAIACCVVFTVLNILSVKMAGRAQVVMVGALLAALGLFVVAGVPAVKQHPNFDHFMDVGWGALFATAGLVFVSFGGLTKVAGIAEEVRQPGRVIPRAMILAWAVVSLFYVTAVFVTVGVTEGGELAGGEYGSLTPLSLAAEKFLGGPGVILLSTAAILAFVTTGNSGILAASRSPMAMSRDNLLPRSFQKLSRRYRTPYVSILATSFLMIVMIALLDIRDLVKVASTMMLILFLLMNVAVLIMRGSKLQNYRPVYRMPLFPWLALAGIAMYGFLIVMMTRQMKAVPLVTTVVFVLLGTLWYVLYVRPRTSRESALVYMVRGAVSKEMYRPALEEELKEIALERDEVQHDRFDHLVRDGAVLDLPEAVDAETMFRLAAKELSPRLGMDEEALLELFRKREAESSTVIHPGVAIPHIIVAGENVFDVLLVRCRKGVRFAGEDEPVRAAFILIGSPDERNYHLRALMAVAHIIQEHGFSERWLEAPGSEHLRDIVLLSGRSRDAPAG